MEQITDLLPAKNSRTDTPLISVIITCYNHGKYLAEAIQSIKAQTYSNFELLIVDDGSIDDTALVSAEFDWAHYIYQPNAGLSAARNTGLKHASGDFILFLDADDRLLPDAIEHSIRTMNLNPDTGFVFGGHRFINGEGVIYGGLQTCDFERAAKPYENLLISNFIAMHGAVLFRKQALQQAGGYDTALPSCEDYDIYLKIANRYKIVYHHHIIAEYRKHGENMTANPARMLKYALIVLKRHKNESLKVATRLQYYQKGIAFWQQYYGNTLFKMAKNNLRAFQYKHGLLQLWQVFRMAPDVILTPRKNRMKNKAAKIFKRLFPGITKQLVAQSLSGRNAPPKGGVIWGDLKRVKPISEYFGYDRGNMPVDRYYIQGFLQRHNNDIYGNVLEIGESLYTKMYGHDVEKAHIFHVDSENTNATYTGEIENAHHIPDNFYDCIIFTQTLQYIYRFEDAIVQLGRILKPGGTLLLTVPGLSPISKDPWSERWQYNFTASALRKAFAKSFPNASELTLASYGNVMVATAAMYGLAAEEMSPEELNYQDDLYQVVNTLKVVK